MVAVVEGRQLLDQMLMDAAVAAVAVVAVSFQEVLAVIRKPRSVRFLVSAILELTELVRSMAVAVAVLGAVLLRR